MDVGYQTQSFIYEYYTKVYKHWLTGKSILISKSLRQGQRSNDAGYQTQL